jgi:glycosyltransferase involved in cell wall biosynthesis
MPKISVIIPTYNRSILVKEAVESVLAQTFKDFEVVVVDDGSTDGTRSVIKAVDDAKVKYYYKENGGVSTARNLGLQKAKGHYVCFLDSDDLWPDNFLEVMLWKLAENPDYDAAYSARTLLYPDGRKVESYYAKYCKSGWITQDLFKKGFVLTSTICLRKKSLEAFFFDKSLRNSSEDSDAWMRLSTRIKFLFVPEIQVVIRVGHNITPRPHFSSEICNRILSLERFYFKLGGDKFVKRKVALRKLSHSYRHVAKKYRLEQCKTAAIFLYKRAIRYWPFDLRLYRGLLRAYLLNKDNMPDWKMPKQLGQPDIGK